MNEPTRHKLLWRWLRLFLGHAQVSLVAIGVGALLNGNLRPVTRVYVIAATAVTIINRLIYHGRPDPNLEKEKIEGLVADLQGSLLCPL